MTKESQEVKAAVMIGRVVDGFEELHLAHPENHSDSFCVASISLAVIDTLEPALAEQWRALTRQLVAESVRVSMGGSETRMVQIFNKESS